MGKGAEMTTFADLEGSFVAEGACKVLHVPSGGSAAPAVVQSTVAADKHVAHEVH